MTGYLGRSFAFFGRLAPTLSKCTVLPGRPIEVTDRWKILLALKSEALKAANTSGAISMVSSTFFSSFAFLLSSHAFAMIFLVQFGRIVETSYTSHVNVNNGGVVAGSCLRKHWDPGQALVYVNIRGPGSVRIYVNYVGVLTA